MNRRLMNMDGQMEDRWVEVNEWMDVDDDGKK